MDVASELTSLVAFKLITYSLGSLLHLFLMVLILGQRRLRRMEWLLFLMMTGLFMWNSGNLMALNVGLFYGVGPNELSFLSRLIPFLGFLIATPLIVHVHVEYLRRYSPVGLPMRLLVVAFYLPLAGAPWLIAKLLRLLEFDPMVSLQGFIAPLAAWMAAALLVAAWVNLQMRRSPDAKPAWLHTDLAVLLGLLAMGFVWQLVLQKSSHAGLDNVFAGTLLLLSVLPSALVGYAIIQDNFLELQVRRNLIYSLVAGFALLLYLNLILKLSGYLERREILPSAVTEGVMIFLLVVLLEPVKKQISNLLHTAFVSEFERVQKLSDEIQEHAKRTGDLESLKAFVEGRVVSGLGLEKVTLQLGGGVFTPSPSQPRKVRVFPIRRGAEALGSLVVTPVTADLSGDLQGALELLAEQLAAAIELCRLIADKVQLERALAEKAKMAFLGEMATRIAHNVKNPLSSMKTLVQLLEEDTSLPERARHDCGMVIEQIDRLNTNISQVLRYAKPARDPDRAVDLTALAASVVNVLRAEGSSRQICLELESPDGPCAVQGGEEAASDIVSNHVVNALQAAPTGSKLRVRVAQEPSRQRVLFWVDDDGPGIPAELKEKIFQPFFTTRPGGTGLGLAIVVRRVEEIGGEISFESPLHGAGRGGTRFCAVFRAAG